MTTGFAFVLPFLPLYVKQLGVQGDARIASWSGILITVAPLLAALLGPWWGRMGDRYGMKIMVERCTLAMCLHWFFFAFARSPYHLLIVRILVGFFGGFATLATPLEFAILDISLHDATPTFSYFDKQGARWTPKPAMRKKLLDFVAQSKKVGIRRLEEGGTSPDEYQRSVEQQLHVSVDGNLAFGKPVRLLTPYSDKYPAGGARALTDGLHGPNDYHCNWLGFEAEHMDAVIDLGEERAFSTVSAGFLQMWYAWIWLPVRVDVAVSDDGTTFRTVASMPTTVADTTSGSFTRQFTANTGSQKARYVRVTAISRLTCPDWHIGAGQKAWIFADEVVIH